MFLRNELMMSQMKEYQAEIQEIKARAERIEVERGEGGFGDYALGFFLFPPPPISLCFCCSY